MKRCRICLCELSAHPVSYTHLDVYKRQFLFKVEVRTVKITYARVSPDHGITGIKQMGEVSVIVFSEDIHETEDILMRDIEVAIELMKMVQRMELTSGIQDP